MNNHPSHRNIPDDMISDKDWKTTLALSFVFFGGHRFYVGKYVTGFIWTFCIGAFYIGWLQDIRKIINEEFTDSKGRYIVKNRPKKVDNETLRLLNKERS